MFPQSEQNTLPYYGSKKAVTSAELPRYGIPYSRVHISRLIKTGQFPAPFKLSANRNAWWESEILDFLESRAATRGAVDPGKLATAHCAAAASVVARAGK